MQWAFMHSEDKNTLYSHMSLQLLMKAESSQTRGEDRIGPNDYALVFPVGINSSHSSIWETCEGYSSSPSNQSVLKRKGAN